MQNFPPDPFVLVDGSSYLFRAFYAMPGLTASNGKQTGAIYGVVNMLRKLIADLNPSKMVVVFDGKEKTFRHQLFPSYKANREQMPAELAEQIQPLHKLITALGIPLIVSDGVEADDVIGTLAMQAAASGLFTVISTGDKDLTQLVNDKIILINTMHNTVLDEQGVLEKFLVPPSKMVDYLTLIGDQVDNIPGIAKVGPKTAVKWLATYGDLAGIVANAANIAGKVGENLRASLALLPLYKDLVTIKTDVALAYLPEQLRLTAQDPQTLLPILNELDFKKWAQDHNRATEPVPCRPRQKQTIVTKAELRELVQILAQVPIFGFTTHTTSADYMQAKLVGIAFSWANEMAAYIPLGHDYQDAPVQLAVNEVLPMLATVLLDPNIAKVGHNLKQDLHVLANYHVAVAGALYDTMLESYILDSSGNQHNLASMAAKQLAYTAIPFAEVVGVGVKQKPFNEVELTCAAAYAAEYADLVLQLHQHFWQQLQQIESLQLVFCHIEMALLPVLLAMERRGVLLDPAVLQQQSIELGARLEELEQQAFALANTEFNLNSPKQLQEVLYTQLRLPILQKTPTGQPSTAEAILQELALDFPLPKIILEYRSLSKLKSTYTDSLPQQINCQTGRVHTSYQQAVTATGRLSSISPNLQNIPIRSIEGRKIRRAFIAAPGYKILSADYSQIELRIMAHLSADPALLAAFAQGIDVHKVTAAEVFNVAVAEVTDEQRRRAKAINFGLLYGMSAFGLAKQLAIEKKEAEQYVEFYFAKFPQVKEFIAATRTFALEHGYVETLFGRRLYLPDIKSKNMLQRKAQERAAINAPMQGGQADIIKMAMINIAAWRQQHNVDLHMLMQVHDELIFEVRESYLPLAQENIIRLMNSAAKLTVPLAVSVGVGDNWQQAH